jgi:hypothetical protein
MKTGKLLKVLLIAFITHTLLAIYYSLIFWHYGNNIVNIDESYLFYFKGAIGYTYKYTFAIITYAFLFHYLLPEKVKNIKSKFFMFILNVLLLVLIYLGYEVIFEGFSIAVIYLSCINGIITYFIFFFVSKKLIKIY